uniref:hypothetical protein n=1 Tax=Microbacterium proteolyticum TaxID=1572644 RepID=UPI002416943C|nr:hypothetical protein [Microbacterium proteolyticum]
MSSSEKTVLGRFVSVCAMVAFAAFLLWLAVWLIQQIWVWLLIAIVLAGVITVTVIFLRYRRDRWFR